MIRRTRSYSYLFIVFMFAVIGSMAAAQQTELTEQDIEFVKRAAVGNMLEIQLGQLALEKAQNQQIRQFGQQMINDHKKAAQKLKPLAQQLGLEIPDSLPERQESLKDALAELEQDNFDQQYLWNMIAAHTVAVNLFQDQIAEGNHPKLVQFAQKMVPKLQQHREKAIDIWTQLGY